MIHRFETPFIWRFVVYGLVLSGCATPPTAPTQSRFRIPFPEKASPEAKHPSVGAEEHDVLAGKLPWWHSLEPGLYTFRGDAVALGVGISAGSLHFVEGFFDAKVSARLRVSEAVDRPAEGLEPSLLDMFITDDGRFFVLYLVNVVTLAENGERGASAREPSHESPRLLEAPASLDRLGRHRVGQHLFEGRQHLFLECEVEGPVANPDWGRPSAAARG